MDDLRPQVRDAFAEDQAALGNLARTSEQLMRNALAAKDERIDGRMQFGAGIAALLMAALVIGTFAYIRLGTNSRRATPPITAVTPTPTVTSPAPTPGTSSIHQYALDVDLIDRSTGWMLLQQCPDSPGGSCQNSVVQTLDGGQTWSATTKAGPPFAHGDGDAPRAIHFLNRSDGFVYGHEAAYVTHDGGITWTHINLPAVFVSSIAGRGNVAWAVTYPCAKGQACPYEVRSSLDGGHTWSSPHSLPDDFSPLDAVPFGTMGLLVPSFATPLVNFGDMAITSDGGATWRLIKSACTSTTASMDYVTTSDGRELWQLCTDFPSQVETNMVLFVSEDGGVSWSQRATSQSGGSLPHMVGGLVSIGPHTAFMITTGILVTRDAGLSWAQVAPAPSSGQNPSSFGAIRFANGTDGWALDSAQTIWATIDGGAHWTPVPTYSGGNH